MALPWGDIATGLAAGGALGWRVYDGIREKRMAKAMKLKNNPLRCGDHEVAIAEIKTDIKNIKEDIGEVKADVKELRGGK